MWLETGGFVTQYVQGANQGREPFHDGRETDDAELRHVDECFDTRRAQ